VPSGVGDGDVFSVRGEGSRMAGRIGDLLLQVKVEKSDVFQRKRNDIYYTCQVSLWQALNGTTLTIPTIHGPVEMRLAPGLQPDDLKKLANKGIYNAAQGEQGHQYVRFKIDIPRTLSPEQLRMLDSALNNRPYSTKSDSTPRQEEIEQEEPSIVEGLKDAASKWFQSLRRWL